MLKPRPKNALVSPLVQYGSLSEPSEDADDLKPVRFMGLLPVTRGLRERVAAGQGRFAWCGGGGVGR